MREKQAMEQSDNIEMKDMVNSPPHYNKAGIECIEAIEAMTENMSGHTAPHAANVLKYLWRHEKDSKKRM